MATKVLERSRERSRKRAAARPAVKSKRAAVKKPRFQNYEWYEVSLADLADYIVDQVVNVEGETIHSFAKDIGVPYSTVLGFLKGRTRFPWHATVWRILEGGGISVSYRGGKLMVR